MNLLISASSIHSCFYFSLGGALCIDGWWIISNQKIIGAIYAAAVGIIQATPNGQLFLSWWNSSGKEKEEEVKNHTSNGS